MFYYIRLPVAEMREGASFHSKVVSQALFGEPIRVAQQAEGWACITTPDGYSGWVHAASLIARPDPYTTEIEVSRLSAHLYTVPDTEYGPFVTVPYGSKLHLLDAADPRWHKIELPDHREAFIQKGDVVPEPADLIAFSKKFLGLPYTWGGRSSFGYDCSGFIQMLYSRLGIQLPRDARQQVLDPRASPVALEALKLGDLVFWGKSEHEIKHVGMCLENPLFIHTSARENRPYLRISSLLDSEWSGHSAAFYPFRTARRLK